MSKSMSLKWGEFYGYDSDWISVKSKQAGFVYVIYPISDIWKIDQWDEKKMIVTGKAGGDFNSKDEAIKFAQKNS